MPALIPLTFAYVIAWLLDGFDRLMHRLCALVGRAWATSENVLDVTAVGMAWIDIIVSDRAAREVSRCGA